MPGSNRGRQGEREDSPNLRHPQRSTPMRSFLLVPLIFFVGVFSRAADDAKHVDPAAWEHSLVQLDVTRKQYDYFQPWSKRVKSGQKTGLVISDREILTTADELFDRTLIRLQKGGRGKWWIGELVWIDYYANLAIVTTRE